MVLYDSKGPKTSYVRVSYHRSVGTLPGGSSPYLKQLITYFLRLEATHNLASVEPPSFHFLEGAGSAADYLYLLDFYPHALNVV